MCVTEILPQGQLKIDFLNQTYSDKYTHKIKQNSFPKLKKNNPTNISTGVNTQ